MAESERQERTWANLLAAPSMEVRHAAWRNVAPGHRLWLRQQPGRGAAPARPQQRSSLCPACRPLYLSTKNTILKKYDGRFMQVGGNCCSRPAGRLRVTARRTGRHAGQAGLSGCLWCASRRRACQANLLGDSPSPIPQALLGKSFECCPRVVPAACLQIFDEIYRTKYQQQFENLGIWWVGYHCQDPTQDAG